MDFTLAYPLLGFMVCGLLLWGIVKVIKSLVSIDESLKDIAKSQRILAKTPKNFEEGKKIRDIEKKQA